MIGTLYKVCQMLRANFLSPKDLVRHAVLIVMLFAVAHVAGLREFTTIISGTVASPSLGVGMCAVLGVGYMALYFGTVVLAPILLLAAGLLLLWEKVRDSSPRHLP